MRYMSKFTIKSKKKKENCSFVDMEIQGTLCSTEGESSGEEKEKKRKRLIITRTDVLYVTLRRSGSQA